MSYFIFHKYYISYHINFLTVLCTLSPLFPIDYIPSFRGFDDHFLRESYLGGATDYYKFYAKNLYYYDVNSLYPYAMLKDMPYRIIKKYYNLENKESNPHGGGESINLKTFFGFVQRPMGSRVICPDNLDIPLLPYKTKEGYTIYPKGIFTGVYFSEELKEVMKFGYKIIPIAAYEFDKKVLFKDYIENFYNEKKQAQIEKIPSKRYIAKLHLNTLYGIFGRRNEILKIITIPKEDINIYLTVYIIKAIIDINSNFFNLLVYSNINDKMIDQLNSTLKIELKSKRELIKSNVAIASAVTAYARIHMIQFKVGEYAKHIVYTDSIFTTKELPKSMIGDDLGLMKKELEGHIISEAYFFGIKKYGFKYTDNEGNIINKSVFAGIERDSLSWNKIETLAKDDILIIPQKENFVKTINDLNIQIIKPEVNSNIKISKFSSSPYEKKLNSNNYLPIELKDPYKYLPLKYNQPKIKLKIYNIFYNKIIINFVNRIMTKIKSIAGIK